MNTKFTTATLLLINSLASAQSADGHREAVYARCVLDDDSSSNMWEVSGKFVLIQYEDSDIAIYGQVHGLEPGSEHYLQVTEG